MIEAGMVAGRCSHCRRATRREWGLNDVGKGRKGSMAMEQGGSCVRRGGLPRLWLDLAGGFGGLVALVALASSTLALPLAAAWAAGAVLLAIAALIRHFWSDPRRGLGPANRVTLVRALLVALLAGMLAAPAWVDAHPVQVAAFAALALLLDGVDGWVARRWRCESDFGARFDMELDAFLILVLCVHLLAMDKAGPWVLVIGAMRYVFVAAMRPWPWLERPLRESRRRKLVCVWQVACLLLCLLPAIGGALATALLVLALALLAWSFAVDVRWLYHTRPQS